MCAIGYLLLYRPQHPGYGRPGLKAWTSGNSPSVHAIDSAIAVAQLGASLCIALKAYACRTQPETLPGPGEVMPWPYNPHEHKLVNTALRWLSSLTCLPSTRCRAQSSLFHPVNKGLHTHTPASWMVLRCWPLLTSCIVSEVRVMLYCLAGALIPFTSREDVDFFLHLEMHMRQEHPPLSGRDHMAYRGSFYPVKDTIDGDLCEQYSQVSGLLTFAV